MNQWLRMLFLQRAWLWSSTFLLGSSQMSVTPAAREPLSFFGTCTLIYTHTCMHTHNFKWNFKWKALVSALSNNIIFNNVILEFHRAINSSESWLMIFSWPWTSWTCLLRATEHAISMYRLEFLWLKCFNWSWAGDSSLHYHQKSEAGRRMSVSLTQPDRSI